MYDVSHWKYLLFCVINLQNIPNPYPYPPKPLPLARGKGLEGKGRGTAEIPQGYLWQSLHNDPGGSQGKVTLGTIFLGHPKTPQRQLKDTLVRVGVLVGLMGHWFTGDSVIENKALNHFVNRETIF